MRSSWKPEKEYEVIVAGGGPAGSTVAALVAQKGHRVLLLEREAGPHFKVGESLMPGTYWSLERLGVLEHLKASCFPRKYSVQFFSASGRASAPFYFFENDRHESAVTWQVLRSEFDALLLDNARAKGAEVRLGVGVREVLFESGRAVGVRLRTAAGAEREVGARVVVDASGRSALLARKLKLRKPDPGLKKASIFTHFEGGVRDRGLDEGATLILHTRDRNAWFWYIPLPADRVSVGVVGELDYLLQGRRGRAQETFEAELKKCAPLGERLARARPLFPVKTTQDFSYRAQRLAGAGWVLAGDAFGFLDPIYSSGVFLALKSGEWAADAINEAFEREDFSAAQLGQFKDELVAGMEALRKLVYAFYTREFSFARFLGAHPQCKQGVIDILSGKLFKEEVNEIFAPLGRMCALPEEVE